MPAPIVAAAAKVGVQVAAEAVQTKEGRARIVAFIAGGLVVLTAPLLLIGAFIVLAAGGAQHAAQAAAQESQACYAPPAIQGQNPLAWAGLNAVQQASATTIVGVVKSAVVVPGGADVVTQQRAAVIAIATSMQESKLTNLPGGDRDSLGLFQQRPSMAWGSAAQIADPAYATTAFLYGAGGNPGLVDVPGWSTLPLTVAAQAVQKSGFPTAYAQWETFATSVVAQLWATAPAVPVAPALNRPDLASKTGTLHPVALQVPAGNVGCDLAGGGTGTTSTWDGLTYHAPAPWGGPPAYANGQIPLAALCVVPWDIAQEGRCDAIAALTALDVAWQADHGGAHIGVTSSYRDYDHQVSARSMWCALGACSNAAVPGTSNHGLALAFDFANFGNIGDFSSPNYLWMKAHAAQFGFAHPPTMDPGGAGPLEPWHWEYMGTPTSTTATATPGAP